MLPEPLTPLVSKDTEAPSPTVIVVFKPRTWPPVKLAVTFLKVRLLPVEPPRTLTVPEDDVAASTEVESAPWIVRLVEPPLAFVRFKAPEAPAVARFTVVPALIATA